MVVLFLAVLAVFRSLGSQPWASPQKLRNKDTVGLSFLLADLNLRQWLHKIHTL
jgi:hypothetical protein